MMREKNMKSSFVRGWLCSVFFLCQSSWWCTGENRAIKFKIPQIWEEPTDHLNNCFFCMVGPSKCLAGKNVPAIRYTDLLSCISPNATLPWTLCTHSSKERATVFRREEQFRIGLHHSSLQKCSWGEKPILPQPKRPQCPDGRSWSHVETQTVEFSSFFTHQDGFCFCYNVTHLFKAIGIACNPSKWYLFIDSSFKSLKAMLLHNRHIYLSLHSTHSVQLKEEYSSVKIL